MIKPIYNLYMIIFYLKFTKNKSLKLNNKTNTNPIWKRYNEKKREVLNLFLKNFYFVSLKIANLICFYLI